MAQVLLGLKVLWWFLTLWRERDDERKKEKNEILDEINVGIQTDSISRISAAIARAGRLR